VLTAESRDSRLSNFELVIKKRQTKKIYEVHDQKFFENEGYSLVDFAYWFTDQKNRPQHKKLTRNATGSLLTDHDSTEKDDSATTKSDR